MAMIDVFYQGEQLGEVQHLALDASSTIGFGLYRFLRTPSCQSAP